MTVPSVGSSRRTHQLTPPDGPVSFPTAITSPLGAIATAAAWSEPWPGPSSARRAITGGAMRPPVVRSLGVTLEAIVPPGSHDIVADMKKGRTCSLPAASRVLNWPSNPPPAGITDHTERVKYGSVVPSGGSPGVHGPARLVAHELPAITAPP